MMAFSLLIDDLLTEHHVLSLSVSVKECHWAAPLFYVFDASNARLLFVTSPSTIHGRMLDNTRYAVVTVAGQQTVVPTLRGLQMWGPARQLASTDEEAGATIYTQRFTVPPHLRPVYWEFVPAYIKATDNRNGFGYKEKWGKSPFE